MNTEQQSVAPFSDEWYQRHIEKALAAEQPDSALLHGAHRLFKVLFAPQFYGAENLPDRGALFVGNHSLFASDGYVIGPFLVKEFGRWMRGLADRFLFARPEVEDFFIENGAVCGHPDVCDALMENGSDIIVFPGGAHEATKTEEQKYQLQWKERYGFVRMAARHGYPIVPMAIVGPDEFYRHWIEGHEMPDTPVWKALVKLGVIDKDMRADLMPPLPLGMFGTLLPKPHRCYVKFGEPVETSSYVGREMTPAEMRKVRNKVAKKIETMIAELLLLREQQRSEDGLLRRILTI